MFVVSMIAKKPLRRNWPKGLLFLILSSNFMLGPRGPEGYIAGARFRRCDFRYPSELVERLGDVAGKYFSHGDLPYARCKGRSYPPKPPPLHHRRGDFLMVVIKAREEEQKEPFFKTDRRLHARGEIPRETVLHGFAWPPKIRGPPDRFLDRIDQIPSIVGQKIHW